MLYHLKKYPVSKNTVNRSHQNIEALFFVALFVLGAVFLYVWFSFYGNKPQVFRDVVQEYTSTDGSNKSAERNLAYALSFAGSCAIFVFYAFLHKRNKSLHETIPNGENRELKIATIALLVSAGTYYLVYAGISPILMGLVIFLMLLYLVDVNLAVSGLIFFVSCIYDFCAIYRLYVYFGGVQKLELMTVTLWSLLISGILLSISHKKGKDIFKHCFLVQQMLIPFSLLVFLASNYKYSEGVVQLLLPRRIRWGIWIVILWFVFLAIREIRKNWGQDFELETSISFGTLCCMMNFNGYSGSGQIISSDIHHPFENIIGFSQIIELGQQPFTEYIPVSGMYSFVQGFFLWLFGNGFYAYYYVAENLFYFAVVWMIVWLARKQIKNFYLFMIALLIPVIRYNRVAFIMPILLLLAWPKLIEHKNLWLKAWLLTSLVHGLYYPVFGAAVCIGYLPLLVYQIVTYIKGDFQADRKKKKFWIEWALCLLPVLLCIPLLSGTWKHMRAMSGQTVYADGISRFGQMVPDSFFSYIQSSSIRLFAYGIFTFLIQASIVWVSSILIMKVGGICLEHKKIRITNCKGAAICASFGIALLIAFTYTLVRIDIYSIYARSAGIIYASAMMILLICERYMKESKMSYVLVGFAVFLIGAVSGEAVYGINSANKLEAYYTVPEEYILAEDGRVPRLGKCFVYQPVYDGIVANFDSTRSLDPDKGYMGIGSFGNFYLSKIKGDSVMETGTIKGYKAAQETVDLMRKNGTVITAVDSFSLYYLYHWLVTSGEYIWSAEHGYFYPNTENVPLEEILEQNQYLSIPAEERWLGRTPSSWGLSMHTLEAIFTGNFLDPALEDTDQGTHVRFQETLNGEEADFIYLTFDGMDQNFDYILFNHSEDAVQTDLTAWNQKLMKKDYNRGISVCVSWTDERGTEHSLHCSMGRGKLLIPLGSGSGWLLNGHDGIKITVWKDGEMIPSPKISEIRLLKLREVE
ncbi:MAG: hypothetical protein K2N87_13750 [Eubacterium sp.]|nr:hypothetical protein [Eubacterium sp.]